MKDIKEKLKISEDNLKKINDFLLKKDNSLINGLLRIVEKYGSVEEINRKARENHKLENLMKRLRKRNHLS